MLEMTDVSKQFADKTALNDVNVYLEKGEAVGMLGPNGAGKTTAISILSSLMPPSHGDVYFEGKPIRRQLAEFRKKVGVIPQEIALFPDLTAEENLIFFGQIYKLSSHESKSRAQALLDLAGLTERKKDKVETFSGGMKRRLNLAAALVHEPEFLLMDEPAVGIDPQSRRYLLDLIKGLQQEKKKTILYTSHYIEEVESVCDRLYVMDRGDVIASGTKEEIKRILDRERTYDIQIVEKHKELEEKLAADERILAMEPIDTGYRVTVNADDFFEELLTMTKASGARMKGIVTRPPTLEDVFLHLTGRKLRD